MNAPSQEIVSQSGYWVAYVLCVGVPLFIYTLMRLRVKLILIAIKEYENISYQTRAEMAGRMMRYNQVGILVLALYALLWGIYTTHDTKPPWELLCLFIVASLLILVRLEIQSSRLNRLNTRLGIINAPAEEV